MAICSNCPGAEVAYDPAQGASVCTTCGAVLEENTITSELTFVEGGDGSSRMVGTFVSAERSGLRSINMRNRRLNTSQSREETLANAKRKFQEVVAMLKGLNDYHVDRATQCYKLALTHNFTQGRKQTHVIAACLYVVCRQEKTMHMLLDFSDVLNTNVFTLGSTFLQLVKQLSLRLPLIDPSIYLSRFAAQLLPRDPENPNSAQKNPTLLNNITQDALRLLQRMKRDWITTGRRPNGLCGACLLIACRMHGLRRTQSDVIKVVRVCDATLRKRLDEFSETESAQLRVDMFRVTDLSEEANPPAFKRARKMLADIPEEEQAETHKESHVTSGEDGGSGGAELADEVRAALSQPELKNYLYRWEDTAIEADVSKWDDLDDGELDEWILTAPERDLKEKVWMEMNSDWLRSQELKQHQKQEAALKQQQKLADPKSGEAQKLARRRQQQKAKEASAIRIKRATTPAEAAKEVISQKLAPKISRKINYAALDQLLDASQRLA